MGNGLESYSTGDGASRHKGYEDISPTVVHDVYSNWPEHAAKPLSQSSPEGQGGDSRFKSTPKTTTIPGLTGVPDQTTPPSQGTDRTLHPAAPPRTEPVATRKYTTQPFSKTQIVNHEVGRFNGPLDFLKYPIGLLSGWFLSKGATEVTTVETQAVEGAKALSLMSKEATEALTDGQRIALVANESLGKSTLKDIMYRGRRSALGSLAIGWLLERGLDGFWDVNFPNKSNPNIKDQVQDATIIADDLVGPVVACAVKGPLWAKVLGIVGSHYVGKAIDHQFQPEYKLVPEKIAGLNDPEAQSQAANDELNKSLYPSDNGHSGLSPFDSGPHPPVNSGDSNPQARPECNLSPQQEPALAIPRTKEAMDKWRAEHPNASDKEFREFGRQYDLYWLAQRGELRR